MECNINDIKAMNFNLGSLQHQVTVINKCKYKFKDRLYDWQQRDEVKDVFIKHIVDNAIPEYLITILKEHAVFDTELRMFPTLYRGMSILCKKGKAATEEYIRNNIQTSRYECFTTNFEQARNYEIDDIDSEEYYPVYVIVEVNNVKGINLKHLNRSLQVEKYSRDGETAAMLLDTESEVIAKLEDYTIKEVKVSDSIYT